MRTHWYAIHLQPTYLLAERIDCDLVADLLDAGHPVFLGDRMELQRLASRHHRVLRVRNSPRVGRQPKRQRERPEASDFMTAFEGAACALLAASAVAW